MYTKQVRCKIKPTFVAPSLSNNCTKNYWNKNYWNKNHHWKSRSIPYCNTV